MARPLAIGIIEPHLERYGGIRRMVETANRLIAREHEVTFYVPDEAKKQCDWIPCEAPVKSVKSGLDDELDVLVFNHEPQWHLLRLFRRARARVFYALHYARVYGKPGSWESLRTDVDLILANSTWTAAMIEEETGERPPVVLGGLSHEYFHPVEIEKEYPILCVGEARPWKGTGTIESAAHLLGLPLERYAGKDLPQTRMAEEYSKAEAFVVGSRFEGFGWPGLEALACGVPLVTTDNGGCRDYAIHEETALLVPPDDPEAMADAIGRLRQTPALAARLATNGLRHVRDLFDWERSVDALEGHLHETVERAVERPAGATLLRGEREERPKLTIVILAWDQLEQTQRCVESIRQHTNVPYEIVIVDNGSGWEAVNYAREAADVAIVNPRNLGFAHGMNQGLAAARGRFVAFCNNDILVPPGWASSLVSHLADGSTGIVVPAVTAARNARTVRDEPGDTVEVVAPFDAPPPAIVYVMETATAHELGGFGEEYEIASAEDVDLAFKVWVNGLDLTYDSRVLVEHVSKGTARTKLIDWEELWRRNRELFLAKWQDPDADIPRLAECPEADFRYRRLVAASVAGWMERYFKTRDSQGDRSRRRVSPRASFQDPAAVRLGRKLWPHVRFLVPEGLRGRLFLRYGRPR